MKWISRNSTKVEIRVRPPASALFGSSKQNAGPQQSGDGDSRPPRETTGVWRSGIARGLGPRDRRFDSFHSDHMTVDEISVTIARIRFAVNECSDLLTKLESALDSAEAVELPAPRT